MQVMTDTQNAVHAKRPGGITALVVMQGIWAIAQVVFPSYLFALSFTHRENASGLRLAALLFALPALLAALGWYGLWKGKLWGWWVSCICGWGMAAIFGYAVIDDGWSMIDWSLVAVAVASLALPVWLVMPSVRHFYRQQ